MHKQRGIRQVLADNLRARMAADESIGDQPKLAARSGVDQSYISKLLKHKSGASVDALEKLARGCRCQPWELLVDEEAIREEAIRAYLARGNPGPQ